MWHDKCFRLLDGLEGKRDVPHSVKFLSGAELKCRASSSCLLALLLSIPTSRAEDSPQDVVARGDVTPYAQASESTDSNLYRIPYNAAALGIVLPAGDSRSDRITDVGVGIDTNFNPVHQTISLLGQVDNVRFDRNTYLDYVGGSGALTWDWQSGATLTGESSIAFQRSLARFVNSRIFSKDLLDRSVNSSNVWWALGADFAVRLVADLTTTHHEAEIEQYQNNRKSSGILALEYAFSDGDTVGLNYKEAWARFRDDQLSYLEKWTYLSLSDSLSVKTRLAVDVGWHERSNPQLARADFSGSVGHASIVWQPTPITDVTIKGWRELNAYIDNESDYFVSTMGGWQH